MAAMLAILIVAAGGVCLGLHARRVADRWVRAPIAADVPFEYQTLTLQEASLASGRVLPIYGSSELFCCGGPFRPTRLFWRPGGDFKALALGKAGTTDLSFLQTFAALGAQLRDRKVVMSISPQWFFRRAGVRPEAYASGFLSETAYAFAFEPVVPAAVRTAGARRMLAYPATLEDDPLLRIALEDVARPTLAHRVEYAVLAPLGGAARTLLRIRDAVRTELLVHNIHRTPRADVTPGDWNELVAAGTKMAVGRDSTNPFGFPDAEYGKFRGDRGFREALARCRAGTSNRDGTVLPEPEQMVDGVESSAEWTDVGLALRFLRDVGARPLVWSVPLPGVYENFTRRSASVRQLYYDRYAQALRRAHVEWVDFREHDEDPWFLVDPGSHFSPRGWAFADRALDLFWHDRSPAEVAAQLSALDRAVPSPGPPLQLARRDAP